MEKKNPILEYRASITMSKLMLGTAEELKGVFGLIGTFVLESPRNRMNRMICLFVDGSYAPEHALPKMKIGPAC